jgi:hypothetical protein
MIGLDLYTHHTNPQGLCNDTLGVYVIHRGFAGGVLRNSERRASVWAGWAPETNTITIGRVKAKAGAVLGVIHGYRASPVLPMATASAAFSIDGVNWVRLSYLPRSPGAQSDGVHISIERGF